MGESQELEAFVREAGAALGTSGSIEEFGVSRILACLYRNRAVRISTNGSYYWVAADLSWDMPSDVGIMWAPSNTYKRAKLFELDAGPPITGDDAFDETYVVVGVGATGEAFAPQIPPAVREALLEFVVIRPDIGWLAPTMRRHLHVKAEPALRTNERLVRFPTMGFDLFTAARAAVAAERAVALAERIEAEGERGCPTWA